MWGSSGTRAVVISVVIGAVLAACGGDDDVDAGGGAGLTSTTESPAPATTATTPTSVPATTPAPVTTATTPAATTPAITATSTTAAPPAGTWVPADELPAWAFPPCCADYWKAPGPSPELPAPGEPLADGVYSVEIAEWSPEAPDAVTLTVRRFELCDRLGELGYFVCDPSWAPDNVGIMPDGEIDVDLPLDDTLAVGLVGVECVDGFTQGRPFTGDGPALAELWSALEADYATWVRGALEKGIDSFALAEQLAADPASPFIPACPEQGALQGVVWASPGGPALLFQALATLAPPPAMDVVPRSPADLLQPVALEIDDGTPTLYLYEGFIS